MAHPDSHMPLYGNDLLAALEGHSDSVGMSYVRALWHYWHHTHCEGLPDNDDYLRRVCRQDSQAWQQIKPIVFGEFFKLDNGKWHQKRCREQLAITKEAYNKRVNAAAAARAARAASQTLSDSNSGDNPGDNSSNRVDSSLGDSMQPKPKPKPKPESLLLVAEEPRPDAGDKEWLDLLGKSPAYLGIDVKQQFDRMVIWCQVNRKKPTRKRFVAWLNRIERPMSAQAKPKYHGPNL